MSTAEMQRRLAQLVAVLPDIPPHQWAKAAQLYNRHRWSYHAVPSATACERPTVYAYRFSPRSPERHAFAFAPSVAQAERERVRLDHLQAL